MKSRTSKTLIFHYPKLLSGVFFVLLLGAYLSVFANPPASPYQPGATLDPTCAPGDTNCFVQIIPDQTGNAGKFLMTDGSVTSWAVAGGSSQWITSGSDIYYDAGKVGIGIKNKVGPFQAGQLQYSAGTASQSGMTITGVGTTWTSAMVGNEFLFADGTTAMITARNSNTSLTVDISQTAPLQPYGIYYAGLYVNDTSGNVSIGSIRNPSSNSRLFIYGGATGANVDARGIPGQFKDIAQFEAEGSDYDTFPNSLSIRYFGLTAAGSQTIMGYDSNRLGVLDFVNNTTSLIRSNTSIQFGGGVSDLVTMTLDPTNQRLGIGTTIPSSKLDITTNALGTAQTNASGLALVNTATAAPGAQQISPAIRWTGSGWKTNSVAASQTLSVRADLYPVQGTALASGIWRLQTSVNGTGYAGMLGIGTDGAFYLGGNDVGTAGYVLTSNGTNGGAYWSAPSLISLSNGSGTTASGTHVDLGGTATGDIAIEMASHEFTIDNVNSLGDKVKFVLSNNTNSAYFTNGNATPDIKFGINTNNPTYGLEVANGGAYVAGGFMADSGTNNNQITSISHTYLGDIAGGTYIDIAGSNIDTEIFYYAPNGHSFTGNVGIGIISPNVALDVLGDIQYTGTITDVSDARLKENVTDFTNGMSIINSIGVKNYNMIATPERAETGFIAQNVKEFFPQAVSIVDPKNGYMGVSYVSFVPVLTKGLQELDLKIQGLSSLDTAKSDSLGSLIKGFLADAKNSLDIVFFGEVHTKKLCLEDVCVTKDQLQQMLNNNNINSGGGGSGGSNSPQATDVCPNIDGDQAAVPDGMHVDGENKCVADVAPEPTPEGDSTQPPLNGETTQ